MKTLSALPASSPIVSALEERVGPHMMETAWKAVRFMSKRETNETVIDSEDVSRIIRVTRKGLGPLETDFGEFWHGCFSTGDRWGDYHALIACPAIDDMNGTPIFNNPEELMVRTDSGCITGQVFHDRTCDCRQQLQDAMLEITERKEGMIIHIPGQDGRGMGLNFKLGTLLIQKELGADTIESATLLRFVNELRESVSNLIDWGQPEMAQKVLTQALNMDTKAESLWENGRHEEALKLLDSVAADIVEVVERIRKNLNIAHIDERTYEGVLAVMKSLGITSKSTINLASNNPHKREVFKRNGFVVKSRPIISKNAGDIANHLRAKATYLGHEIPKELQ